MDKLTEEQILKMYNDALSQKARVKKYHQTEKGKMRKREAQKRYYYKKKAEKTQQLNNELILNE